MGLLSKLSNRDLLVEQLKSELEEKSFRLALLLELSKAINSTTDAAEILKLILQAVEAVSQAEAVSVALINKQEQLNLVAGRGFANFAAEKQAFALNFTDSPIWTVYLSGEPYLGWTDEVSVTLVTAAFPLIYQQKVLGVVNIHKVKRPLNEEEVQFMEILATQAAMALQNAANFKRVQAEAKAFEEKANTDAMTKLYNRLFMMERFPEELSRAKRTGAALTLLAFDVDKFKTFNDTHGHLFGDIVLKDVARLLRETIREYDIPIRYGGEEFLAILPETSVELGVSIAERIRKAVEAHTFIDPEKEIQAKVTISIGVAEWDKKAEMKELIDQADTALYRAKEEGRNRVVRYRGQ